MAAPVEEDVESSSWVCRRAMSKTASGVVASVRERIRSHFALDNPDSWWSNSRRVEDDADVNFALKSSSGDVEASFIRI